MRKVQSKPPPTKKGIIQVSCGNNHTGAVTEDGRLYMWGHNSVGQLGDGTTENRKIPVLIKINGNPWIVKVACGGRHTGVVTSEGKLYMWGDNSWGQLGAVTGKNKPILIKERIVQVSCGGRHTGAVTAEGKLYMWGINNRSQLGDGTTTDRELPTLIKIKGNPKIVQVSCGTNYTGVVTAEGKLHMWGANSQDQLGATTGKNKPILIKERIVQVSCGDSHTGAVTEDGRLYMWGNNRFGQLGGNISANTPKLIMKGISQVSCGKNQTGVITENDKLEMWGRSDYGQLRNIYS